MLRKYSNGLQAVVDISHGEPDCSFPTDKVLGSIVAILFLSLVLLVVGFKFRCEIKIILYMKLGLRPFDKKDDNICGKASADLSWEGKWLLKFGLYLWWLFIIAFF